MLQVSRAQKMLGDEFGTASNIKNRVNRQSVLGAITSAQQRLKLYNKVSDSRIDAEMEKLLLPMSCHLCSIQESTFCVLPWTQGSCSRPYSEAQTFLEHSGIDQAPCHGWECLQVPPNGLVIYTGTVMTDDGKEKKLNIDFEPFKPINTSLYLCDNKFHTEALNELLESDSKCVLTSAFLDKPSEHAAQIRSMCSRSLDFISPAGHSPVVPLCKG